jgi:subtilisin family serine protease
VNLSLKTKGKRIFEGSSSDGPFVVAAAGNHSEVLDSGFLNNLPASLSENDILRHRMLVVGALQPNEAEPFWPNSARSKTLVDIAAPGALLVSLDEAGGRTCMSGTSGAAPLVSFTAAVLKSLGLKSNLRLKARILGSADYDPRLAEFVDRGRRLNVAAALDVFVDQVHMQGESAARRGWIEPAAPLTTICAGGMSAPGLLGGAKGKIDLANLFWWERTPGANTEDRADDAGEFEHALRDSVDPETCAIPSGSFTFWNATDGTTTQVPWDSVNRIIPSPFRGARDIVMQMQH